MKHHHRPTDPADSEHIFDPVRYPSHGVWLDRMDPQSLAPFPLSPSDKMGIPVRHSPGEQKSEFKLCEMINLV